MKILHIINSLKKGGAEGNLFRLCKFHKSKFKKKIDITILTLIDDGYYEKKLKKIGVKILSLNLYKNIKYLDFINKIIYLRNFVKKYQPNIIQSWMYHSNFITLFISKEYFKRIFWNIRHSELNFEISKKKTIFISIICGLFSRIVPKKIIYCSEKSINFHEKTHFYSKQKTKLILNGYSNKTFFPSDKLRIKFRKKYKIKKSDIVVGYAGRYAKQKNIFSLLEAFSRLIKYEKNTYLYMVGKDISANNKELMKYTQKLKLKNKVFLLGQKKNLIEFYNGIDFLTLTSHSESFPNVLAESMLCSTPVLSSDAGCAKKIINNYGFVMQNNTIKSIFKNLRKTIYVFKEKKNKWKILKRNSQLQIENNFSVKYMANSYLKNWIF